MLQERAHLAQDTPSWLPSLPSFETTKASLELIKLLNDPIYTGEEIPRGNGDPVLVVPGIWAINAHTKILENWLTKINYFTFSVGKFDLMMNLGHNYDMLAVNKAVSEIAERTKKKVTIIGHSMGGTLAFKVAHDHTRVKHVITIGTPIDTKEELSPKVRSTHIYSANDPFFDPDLCKGRDPTSNFQVSGSHFGLVWNREVYRILGNILHEK